MSCEPFLVNSASIRLRLDFHNLKFTSEDTLDTFKYKMVHNAKYRSVNNKICFADEELLSTLFYGLDVRFAKDVNFIERWKQMR